MATTAAVLNILIKANSSQAQASLAKTQGALVATEKKGGRTAAKLKSGMKIAGVGMAAGLGIAAVATKKFIEAASESEASNARMRAQLKASGISFGKHKDQIEKVIAAQSKLSALDDEDLQDSFTNIVRVTGDVNKALKLNALAADFARAKNIDVAKAGEIVAKVAGGNVGVLGRYGIKIKDGATATEALGALQKKFAGQAKAYGETSAGAADRFKVAIGNLQETIGARLLPVFTKVTNFAANFVTSLLDGSGAAGGFATKVGTAFKTVGDVVGKAVAMIREWLDDHRDDVRAVVAAVVAQFNRVVWLFKNVILPVAKRTWEGVIQILKGALKVIGGIINVISGILTGDFRRAWNGVKQIFSGSIQAVLGIVRAYTAPFREAAARVGGAIGGAFSAAWGKVKDIFRDAKGWISDRFADLKGMASSFATAMRDRIVGAFKGAVNKVVDFVNAIISVVNKVPGVEIGKVGKMATGGKFQAFARGGAFARTRGKVDKPITLMGEEAPRWPEYVIPTNPAYRSRAQGLAMEAMGQIGMYASGGKFGTGGVNIPSPSDLIGKLPGVKQLGWLSGLGSYVIGKVGSWIKKQVGSLLGAGIPNWGPIDQLAGKFGLSITSTFRRGDDGYHGIPFPGLPGRARATDYSNGYATSGEAQFAQQAAARWGKVLKELIHSPLGWGIKNGSRVDAKWFGDDVYRDHFDHVHVAFAQGGKYGRGQDGIVINMNGPINMGDQFASRTMAADLAWRLATA